MEDNHLTEYVEEWNPFHLTRMRLDYFQLKDFVNYEWELLLKQLLTTPQQSLVSIPPQILMLPLKLGNDRLSQSLGWKFYVNYALSWLWKMRHTSFWECLIHISIKTIIPSLFENVVLGSLKSIFQLDHQLHISLYLTQASALC